jgi:hypothetical protein
MLPCGSEEQDMANESLARIMYGTSEEAHAPTNGSANLGLTSRSLTENGNESNVGEETLGELLHRVWMNVSGKH